MYPNVHFLNRQAAREKLAARQALTEAARERHLALAEHYSKRAEAARIATQLVTGPDPIERGGTRPEAGPPLPLGAAGHPTATLQTRGSRQRSQV